MDYVIRKKEREDCKDTVHVVTVAWNETYKGIVPDDILTEMYNNEDIRVEREYKNLENNDVHKFVLEVDGKVVGFVNVGKSTDADYPDAGEIYAIYIIKKYQGYGYGRKMMETGIEELKKMGFKEMIISCLEGNPTNEFYKYMGGNLVKKRIFERLNLPENVYYFVL